MNKKLKDSFLWESSSQAPYDLILAGNYLFLGDQITLVHMIAVLVKWYGLRM